MVLGISSQIPTFQPYTVPGQLFQLKHALPFIPVDFEDVEFRFYGPVKPLGSCRAGQST